MVLIAVQRVQMLLHLAGHALAGSRQLTIGVSCVRVFFATGRDVIIDTDIDLPMLIIVTTTSIKDQVVTWPAGQLDFHQIY